MATDNYGDLYVASYGSEAEAVNGKQGRIDIFDPEGFFITELKDPEGPKSVAVDSEGNLYVYNFHVATTTSPTLAQVVRYEPSSYSPSTGEIEYGKAPAVVQANGNSYTAVVVSRTNDHLFVNNANRVTEYSSAAEENKLLDDTIGLGTLNNLSIGAGLAVDATRGRVYVNNGHVVDVFSLDVPHPLLGTIKREATPDEGEFVLETSVAVDESTGHVFVFDAGLGRVYEFTEDGEYVSTISHNFQHVSGSQLTVDNGGNSPNGALNSDGRYLYVPSGPSGVGHSFAFSPIPQECAPEVETIAFAKVTETEALLEASIEPCNLPTHYTVEYEREGTSSATIAGEGDIPAGATPIPISASAEGLEPNATYRFRVLASNEKGSDEAEGDFSTYSAEAPEPVLCPNKALRVGPSALLPDCRAYELVTPSDTNARAPLGVGHLGTYFTTRQASPQGDAVNFEIEGGSIPGFEATGSYAGDPYVARRTETGWMTQYTGPSGEESPAILPGSNSPDQGYSFWGTAGGEGTAAVEEGQTSYVRYPDGHSALVGRGSLAEDPRATGKLISEDGGHILFVSTNSFHPAIPLEENAPAEGTETIYDRTADEVTHVVSLLPEDETPAPGQNAFYEGASLDGKGVAFKFGGASPTSALYLRYDNEETYEVAGPGSTFAGFSEGGKRIFYLEGGDLFAFEVGGTENPIAFSTTGNVTPVNVSADGSTAYFVSPSVLGEENPNGMTAQPGQQNLYRSEEGQISFVGTVTERDVKGENNGNEVVDGLGLWTAAVGGRFGRDPSRTTPNGQVLLFSSRAALDGYDPEGHAEIYRYDAAGTTLDCLSCNPTLAKATGNASLQPVSQEQGAPEPFSSYAFVENLRSGGGRAFFQSTEPLVVGDIDGLQDVYEWEADGVGSCKAGAGCVYLISSGQSNRADYLFAASRSGDDVFFISANLLTGADTDETPSIYDARVGGGFAESKTTICQEESCHPAPSSAPSLPVSRTPALGDADNVVPPKHCSKGKRLVKRGGKELCIKKKKHHRRHHRKASSKRKGAGR